MFKQYGLCNSASNYVSQYLFPHTYFLNDTEVTIINEWIAINHNLLSNFSSQLQFHNKNSREMKILDHNYCSNISVKST